VLEKTDSSVRLTVADTGEGIDPELLPYVFNRFRQGRAHPNAHSVGLGLSIVKQVIEAHGGTVEATSNGRGKGSTFIVTLPYQVKAALETSGYFKVAQMKN
jgi:signal transduction histidine kinase